MSRARSGLQKEVLSLYKEAVRTAMSKPKPARPAFLLHFRYNFRHPQLGPRDYTAIEHQLRKMSRQIESLSDPTVSSISTTHEAKNWWEEETRRSQGVRSSPRGKASSPSASQSASATTRGPSKHAEHQWGGTLPGHGGT